MKELKQFQSLAPNNKTDIENIRWDLRISSIQEIRSMAGSSVWFPERITKIELADVNLKIFHVGEFKGLVHLDLSNNKISNIRGNGLEQLVRLQYLNLQNNLLKKENFRAFCFLPSLRYLFLEGNKELGNYRAIVIALTRNLLGDNRSPGLLQLDGKIITVEERVRSIIATNKKENENQIRWKYDLIAYYGHKQSRSKEFLTRVRHLRLPNKRLNVVDVGVLVSLEVLDLSKNNLRTVNGLEVLTKLRLLNLSNNLKLSLRETLPKLSKTKTLEVVAFGVTDQNHKLYHKSPKYRIRVLSEILFNNPNLATLDDEGITLSERVEAYRALGGSSTEQVEIYRFHLALNCNATMIWGRKYHFSEVAIGNQYDPAQITVLRRMNGHGLISSALDFRSFTILEELNLSNNKLSSIHTMGLEELKKLRILDVSKNLIDTPLKELAAYIDKLQALEILAIRENPCMRNFNDRMTLIGCMNKMKEITCHLKVLDTEITLDERVESWKKVEGLVEEPELMRYKAIMFLRAPSDIPANRLTSLDLGNGGLEHLDLGRFENLEVLLLKGNRIKTIDALGGLKILTKLKVLDLRKNLLGKMEEIPKLVTTLPNLASLGVKGNKFCDSKNWRQKLIGLLPQLHDEYVPLRLIDNQEITVLEIVKAWKFGSEASPDRIRFQVVQLRQVPKDMPSEQVKELNLANCEFVQLSEIDLAQFKNLERISLANNNIKSIQDGNLDKLQELQALDLSGNKLKEIQTTIDLVNKLPKIQMIYLDGNPCWGNDFNEKLRCKFLGEIVCLINVGASLKYLNGYSITIAERCKGLFESGVYNSEGLERFRIDLIWEKNQPKETTESLDMSGGEIQSLRTLPGRISKLPALRHLDLSNNLLSSLDELDAVLQSCMKLTSLDLRDNRFEAGLKDITAVIRIQCPGLRKLWLEKSTKDKETQKPKEYAHFVFSQLFSLEEVDGIAHPQHFNLKKAATVFDLDWSGSPRDSFFSEKDEIVPTIQIETTKEPLKDSSDNDVKPVEVESTDTYFGGGFYPYLSALQPESYLPQDYHHTIGRKYDLRSLVKESQNTVGEDDEDEEED